MRRALAGLVMGVVFSAAPVQGQVAWDGPLFVSPAAPAGWGLYLVDPSPGSNIGVLTTWRAGGPLGFRVGLAEDRADKLSVYGGIDVSGRLVDRSDDFPLDLDWVAGAGAGIGDGFLLGFPLGVSLGRDFQADGVWFNPYVAPRVVLDAWMGSGDTPVDGEGPGMGGRQRRDDGLELSLALDLGVDISFDPGWAIRFGASLVDRRAVGIGFSFRVL